MVVGEFVLLAKKAERAARFVGHGFSRAVTTVSTEKTPHSPGAAPVRGRQNARRIVLVRQGLKPIPDSGVDGTAEAVPYKAQSR